MKQLEASYYFDLESFEHATLFAKCRFVWEALDRIEPYLLSKKLGVIIPEIREGVYLENPERISIGKGTVIEPGAFIKGPCLIGENCVIRHGAYIRGNLITGNECVIGHDTEVKNSVFLNKAHAPHFAYVGDTILGNRVNLGAGTVCANLRLDGAEIGVVIEGVKHKTGRRKFGAIIGDDSKIGCNTVINPGSLLGKLTRSNPCTNFGGFIPSNMLIKNDVRVQGVINPHV